MTPVARPAGTRGGGGEPAVELVLNCGVRIAVRDAGWLPHVVAPVRTLGSQHCCIGADNHLKSVSSRPPRRGRLTSSLRSSFTQPFHNEMLRRTLKENDRNTPLDLMGMFSGLLCARPRTSEACTCARCGRRRWLMNIWQKKLLALLHDPPHKALDIQGHEDNRLTFARQAGFTDPTAMQWFDKPADWWASAADRFPAFHSKLRSSFGGAEHPFRHPLGGSDLPIPEFPSAEVLGGWLQDVQPRHGEIPSTITGDERDRINFFLHWRRWAVEAANKDWRTAFQPADTRLPDHPVWLHNSIASALQGCRDEADGHLKPAFLLFQLGPVQEFIAQARSTRDLWSGSYLLSWLIAHAIKAITDRIGPDAVIFPFLRAQPLFDLLHRDEIFKGVTYKNESMWDRMRVAADDILVPNLPNRFLVLVPANQGADLASVD